MGDSLGDGLGDGLGNGLGEIFVLPLPRIASVLSLKRIMQHATRAKVVRGIISDFMQCDPFRRRPTKTQYRDLQCNQRWRLRNIYN